MLAVLGRAGQLHTVTRVSGAATCSSVGIDGGDEARLTGSAMRFKKLFSACERSWNEEEAMLLKK